MARPRKPSKVLELTGAFKKDPQRKRKAEPMPSGAVGDPPLHLALEVKDVWRELSATCFWATDADRQIMEVTATLMHQFRINPAEFKQMNHLLSGLGKLGLTPSDRAKVTVPEKPQAKSKWAK